MVCAIGLRTLTGMLEAVFCLFGGFALWVGCKVIA